MTRQRRWQLRKQAEGKCVICGQEAIMCVIKKQLSQYCANHLAKRRVFTREALRKLQKSTKRYYGAKSYQK